VTGARFGQLVFVISLTVAALGMALWQDWWMLVFPLGGGVVAMLASRISPSHALAAGLAAAGSALAIGVGLFVVVMGSLFGYARPCVNCSPQHPTWLYFGLGAIGFGLLLAVAAVWLARRARPRDIR
jgi:hypothetical protein